MVTRRVPCRHRPKALEREAASGHEQLVSSGGEGDEGWVATHLDRPSRPNNVDAAGGIPDIEMMDDIAQDDEIRDMDIDDIPGLEDMQMPSDDDESDNETARKLYLPCPVVTESNHAGI